MSRRILVVDDEPGLASLYAAWLEGQYEVETVTDGEAALTAVEAGVDAVLLDRQMPGRSGDEVLACLRRRGHRCPVALVTAARPDRETFDLPFDAYLHKPVGAEDVRACVGRLLAVGEYDAAERRHVRLAAKVAVAKRVAAPQVRAQVVERLERERGAVATQPGETGDERGLPAGTQPESES